MVKSGSVEFRSLQTTLLVAAALFALFMDPSCRVVPRDMFLTAENAQEWIFLPSNNDLRSTALQISAYCEDEIDEIRYRLANLRPSEWVIVGEESEVAGCFIEALVRMGDGRLRVVTNYWQRGTGFLITEWPECDVLCQSVEDLLHSVRPTVAPYAIERDPVLPGTARVIDLANNLSHMAVPETKGPWGRDELTILTVSWHTKKGKGRLVFDKLRLYPSWQDHRGNPHDRGFYDVLYEIWTLLTQEVRAEDPPVWHIWGELYDEPPVPGAATETE